MTRNPTVPALRSAKPSNGDLHTPSTSFTPASSDRRSPRLSQGLSSETAEYSDEEMHPTHTSGVLSEQPLLSEDKRSASSSLDQGDRHGHATRRTTFRSENPTYAEPKDNTKQRYIYAGFCLLISLVSFVVQTETAVYIQHEMHWNKAYCMLWLTHGSWVFLWPTQLLFLRIQKRKLSWAAFWRRHKALLRSTAQMVQHQDLALSAGTTGPSPVPYMLKTTAFVTTFLTIAGASWYVAIDMTSPSDLTAIYNCSAFFAYVFSIMLLHDKVRMDKVLSVGLAVIGVLVVAYGDKEDVHPKTPGHSGGATNPNPESPPNNRLLGNLIIGFGSVLYGLYEVLYKKYACPPEGTSPQRGMIFANTFGSLVGAFTLTVLWIPLPILHFTGVERFELPTGKTAMLLTISTLSNATFSGSFLILMSLTSPVLSSVAALLTIFLVAIVDWLLTGKALSLAALSGGLLIIVAFLLLSWATYREMQQGEKQREEDGDKDFEDEEELDDDQGEVEEYNVDHFGNERRQHRAG